LDEVIARNSLHSSLKVQDVAGQWILTPYWFYRAPTIELHNVDRASQTLDRMLQNAVVVVNRRKNASLYIV